MLSNTEKQDLATSESAGFEEVGNDEREAFGEERHDDRHGGPDEPFVDIGCFVAMREEVLKSCDHYEQDREDDQKAEHPVYNLADDVGLNITQGSDERCRSGTRYLSHSDYRQENESERAGQNYFFKHGMCLVELSTFRK